MFMRGKIQTSKQETHKHILKGDQIHQWNRNFSSLKFSWCVHFRQGPIRHSVECQILINNRVMSKIFFSFSEYTAPQPFSKIWFRVRRHLFQHTVKISFLGKCKSTYSGIFHSARELFTVNPGACQPLMSI